MSRTVKETTLLEYVIAYLQEERDRVVIAEVERDTIETWVEEALDAYKGGAR